MASCSPASRPVALILGHSFVKRLHRDLLNSFDLRASLSFDLEKDAVVQLHGVGGRTVNKLVHFDLSVVANLNPDIVILEIGTNDLSFFSPELVGSSIDDLVCLLIEKLRVKVVGVCQVIPRVGRAVFDFNAKAKILNNYLDVVLSERPQVFCWTHKGFANPTVCPFLPDGVHVNFLGQYSLYRSYRGAMMKALRML